MASPRELVTQQGVVVAFLLILMLTRILDCGARRCGGQPDQTAGRRRHRVDEGQGQNNTRQRQDTRAHAWDKDNTTPPEASIHADGGSHLREAALFLFLSVISCCGMLLAEELALVPLRGLLGLLPYLSTERGQGR